MKIENVKVGMKVVPFQKTPCRNAPSYRFEQIINKKVPFLYVNEIRGNNIIVADFIKCAGGDFFYASDFEPYEEDKQVSYIEQVAKMLGVEVGEKFNVNDLKRNPYRLEENGLVNCNNINCDFVFSSLITGKSKLEKIIPYANTTKAKLGSSYYYVSHDGFVKSNYNQGATFDHAMYALGDMFDTNKIPQQQIDEMVKKLKGDES